MLHIQDGVSPIDDNLLLIILNVSLEHLGTQLKNSELWKPRESKVRQIKMNVNYRWNQAKQESLKNRQETKDG